MHVATEENFRWTFEADNTDVEIVIQ